MGIMKQGEQEQKLSYSDLLRDPRWQRKRLEVMQRANFTCEHCGRTDRTLNVHHPRYVAGRKPWEYETTELRCLCEPCHALEHDEAAQAAITERAQREREREATYRREYPEAAAIEDRMKAIDGAFVGADADTRDALILEKVELAERLRGIERPLWRQWKSFTRGGRL